MDEKPWLAHYPSHTRWDEDIPHKTLLEALAETAKAYPKRTCIEFLGKSYRYCDIALEVSSMAVCLRELGIQKGDRVALLLPNCPMYIIAYYGVLKAGGVVVNCNPLYSETFIANELNDAEAKFLITLDIKMLYDKAYAVLQNTKIEKLLIASMARMLPLLKRVMYPWVKRTDVASLHSDVRIVKLWKAMRMPNSCELVPALRDGDLAVLQYTGGTTGVPKAAMLTHRNVYANAYQCALWLGLDRKGKDTIMGVIPFFHCFAMTVVMNLGVLMGMTIIAHPRFDLRALMRDMVRKKPSLMPGVPSMFVALNHTKNVSQYDFSSLEICISGGAPLPGEVKAAFEKLTGCKLVEGYGLTEATPLVSCNPLDGNDKTGTIGLPFPQTEVLIEDMENRGTFLEPGKIGELCVTGPQVMKGYWRTQEETDIVLRDGVLRTGDIAVMDEQGFITIKDRLKELIISGGYNIYPKTIEDVLYKHPAVKEAAVIGIADAYRGQAVKIFLVIKEGQAATEDDIRQYLKIYLAKYEMPKEIVFRDTLPKTQIGKISKKDLI